MLLPALESVPGAVAAVVLVVPVLAVVVPGLAVVLVEAAALVAGPVSLEPRGAESDDALVLASPPPAGWVVHPFETSSPVSNRASRGR